MLSNFILFTANWSCSVFYLLGSLDMGKPSNITVTSGISFDYGSDKKKGLAQPQPQIYRDVEATGALGGQQTRKTGTDSPVII